MAQNTISPFVFSGEARRQSASDGCKLYMGSDQRKQQHMGVMGVESFLIEKLAER